MSANVWGLALWQLKNVKPGRLPINKLILKLRIKSQIANVKLGSLQYCRDQIEKQMFIAIP